MADMMTFPETWEEFEKSYGFVDDEEAYTNGSRLIPSFRVKQWLDHIAQFKSKRQATVSSDCISRQDAIELVENSYYNLAESIEDTWAMVKDVEQLPSAQPEIIRCKDCEYGEQDEVGRWFCRSLGCQIGNEDGSGYCADAERRTDNANANA